MNERKKVLAIINPISGTRSKQHLPTVINELLDKSRFDVSISTTQYAGHATVLTQEAVDNKADYVISIGGDGTCNEVAKALINTSTTLAIVPIGSGNGLARHLNIPIDVRRALRIIAQEEIETIDYCTANGHVFFCTCGVGFDAEVSQRFAHSKHRGGLSYARHTIETYLNYQNETYRIVSNDGEISEKAFLIACGNAAQYGNNAFITPRANIHDGLLDITVIKPFSPLEVGPLTLQLFTKWIDKNPNIKTFEKSEITIIRTHDGVMHIDGDPVHTDANIVVKCIKGGLKTIVPKQVARKSVIEPIHDIMIDFFEALKG